MRPSLLLCLLCLWPAGSAGQEPTSSPDIPLRLIWFGGTHGVSSHVSAHAGVRVASDTGDYRSIWSGPLAFVSDERVFFSAEGLTVEAFTRALTAGDEKTEVVREDFPVLVSPFERIFFSADTPDQAYETLIDVKGVDSPYDRKTATLKRVTVSGVSALMLDFGSSRPLSKEPSHWEVRFAEKGSFKGQPMYVVGRPLNEGSRRSALIQGLIAGAAGETLAISSGENVETHSYLASDKPDLQRPNTWRSMKDMSINVMVPGASELAFGVPHLSKETQAAEVQALAANYPLLKGPGWMLKSVSGAQILILGLVDPSVSGAEDPVRAVEVASAAASKKLGRRPDLVIATGHLSATTRARLAAESRHLDLVLGNFDHLGIHPEAISQTASGSNDRVERAYERHPVTVVQPGDARIGVIDLTLRSRVGQAGYVLQSLNSKAIPITTASPRQKTLSQSIQAVRQTAFSRMQRPLLPDLGPIIDSSAALKAAFMTEPNISGRLKGGAPVQTRLTAALWRRLCVQVFRGVTGTDIALLPNFTVGWGLTGSTSILRAVANFNVPGEIVVTSVSGAKLKAGLAALRAHKGPIAGLHSDTVNGYKVDPRETYQIAWTRELSELREFSNLVSNKSHLFREEGGGLIVDPKGQTRPVREVVIQGLTALGRGPASSIADLMSPPSSTPEARWMLDIKQLSLGAHQYRNAGEQTAFGEVKETRVTTADNRSVSYRGGMDLVREGPAVTWISGVQLAYDKAYYEDSEDQETADELKFATELRVPAWTWSALGSVPFAGAGYATEFTPTEGETGTNPRKKLVEGTLGLTWKTAWLKSAKLAGVIARDLSAEIDDPQYGFLLSLELKRTLPFGAWFLNSESRYFLPGVGEDDASELGLTVAARTGIDVPIWRRLSIGVFLDTFVYRGQVVETREFGSSFISGFALKYDHRLRLNRRGP